MTVQTQPEQPAAEDDLRRAGERDELAAYLMRGRLYEHLDTGWVRVAWARIFRRWRSMQLEAMEGYQFVADLRAELALRNEKPPYDAVQPELQPAPPDAAESDTIGGQVMAQIMAERRTRGLSS